MATGRAKTDKRPGITAIWAITPNGIRLGQRLCSELEDSILLIPEKEGELFDDRPDPKPLFFKHLKEELAERFSTCAAHIFLFSTGISVRLIAPLLTSKTEDPGVVVVDEKGFHAISLVSGHLGGANALAKKTAAILGAVPVITTATDINGLPSIDLLAKEKDLAIVNPNAIKHVNMKFLKGIPIRIHDPGGFMAGSVPKSLISAGGTQTNADLVVTHNRIKVSRETLLLSPPVLSVGIGCNRGTSESDIHDFLVSVFTKHHLSLNAISALATTEVKKDEKGILKLAERLGCRLIFYTKEQLNSVESIQNPSQMARKYLGVNSVCEAGAILGAGMGPLIITKEKTKDVTIAVAMMK